MEPNTQRRFFVIGYPRSRTAWLSVFLNDGQTRCEHEASIRATVLWPQPIIGTCDAALMFQVEDLLERFPDAAWVMIERDSKAALCASMAAWPDRARQWQERWPDVEAAYAKASALLEGRCLRVAYTEINNMLPQIFAHCTGLPMLDMDWIRMLRLRDLKITQQRMLPKAEPLTAPAGLERLTAAGINISGLTVRAFQPTRDALHFVEWAGRALEGTAALLSLLPPLGIVVEDADGPAAMIWCRESYGTPVADLEYGCTRPGLSLKAASAAMAFAVTAAMELAGQQVVPQASYSVFRITCRPSLGRFAQRLGFVPHGTGNCQKYLYQK